MVKVYLNAAELIAKGSERYCCSAINWSENLYKEIDLALTNFREVFNPQDNTSYWWGFQTTKKSQLERSLALLFMAEMEKDKNR